MGVNKYDNTLAGQYMFYDIPFGEELSIVAQDTLHPYSCIAVLNKGDVFENICLSMSIENEASDTVISCYESDDKLNDWLENNGGATVTDACGEVVWTNDFNGLSDECGNTGNAEVTFTAIDECGSTVSTTALTLSLLILSFRLRI